MVATNSQDQTQVKNSAAPTGGAGTTTQQSAQPQVQKEKQKTTVLLVEDDPVLSRMYAEKFKNEGYTVRTANNGETGLEIALKGGIGLILLDIMLPKMSGTDMLVKLRKNPKFANIPVVVLTNLAEKEEQERLQKLGVKEYLVKAMQTPEKVIEVVKKYCDAC